MKLKIKPDTINSAINKFDKQMKRAILTGYKNELPAHKIIQVINTKLYKQSCYLSTLLGQNPACYIQEKVISLEPTTWIEEIDLSEVFEEIELGFNNVG